MKTKVLIYCTKGNKTNHLHKIYGEFNQPYYCVNNVKGWKVEPKPLNGTIVAECEVETEKFYCCCVPYRKDNNLGYEHFVDNGVYKVEWKENINLVDECKKYNNPDIYKNNGVVFERKDKYIDTMLKNSDLKEMCLTPQELLDYITLGNNGYASHISNLKIFDKPLELSSNELLVKSYKYDNCHYLKKAPMNMCWVFHNGEWKVLISIRPQWVCKILNGEKKTEVRRKVVKGMVEQND